VSGKPWNTTSRPQRPSSLEGKRAFTADDRHYRHVGPGGRQHGAVAAPANAVKDALVREGVRLPAITVARQGEAALLVQTADG